MVGFEDLADWYARTHIEDMSDASRIQQDFGSHSRLILIEQIDLG